MTNAPITRSIRPNIGTLEMPAATFKERQIASGPPETSGVLKALALARWRGAAIDAPILPRTDAQDRWPDWVPLARKRSEG